ncbi:hypothetical protein CRUP_033671 [Coryphaenoides rupestris]|nr:hypothetical protein CRUP_033671 [Coryphaenoides rupestris]
MLLVGCKSDLRTDLSTLVELSSHRRTPVSYDQISAVYIECSAQQSENSVRDIFHVATLACVNKTGAGGGGGGPKRGQKGPLGGASKRVSHVPSRPELASGGGGGADLRKDKAKSCSLM